MELNRCQFELLAHVEEGGKKEYSWRDLADARGISGSLVSRELETLVCGGFLQREKDLLAVTEEGREALEPYRVRRAVIFAAGFGSRMAPVTLDTPKPLVKIGGVRMIDRLLDALTARGITDITVVRGYKKEQFRLPFLTGVHSLRKK